MNFLVKKLPLFVFSDFLSPYEGRSSKHCLPRLGHLYNAVIALCWHGCIWKNGFKVIKCGIKVCYLEYHLTSLYKSMYSTLIKIILTYLFKTSTSFNRCVVMSNPLFSSTIWRNYKKIMIFGQKYLRKWIISMNVYIICS